MTDSIHFQPENVVCTQKENTSVKIIDFGTAKELEPTEKVSIKNYKGSERFILLFFLQTDNSILLINQISNI